MKRLFIVIIILLAGWIVFDRMESIQKEQKQKEDVQTEDVVQTEENVEENEENEGLVFEEDLEGDEEDVVEEDVSENEEVIEEETVITKEEYFLPKNDSTQEVEKVEEVEEVDMQALIYDDFVKVYLYEWEIDLSTNEVEAGHVGFEVVNNGVFSHRFGIRGVQDFGKVIPGETRVFSANLVDGTFEIYSPKRIDMENNMEELLTVK